MTNHSTFLPYEDIAGTMCHELAHCMVGPHNAAFYKAMEEIEEQYAVFLARGVVVDGDGFPVGSGEAHVLGHGGGGIGRNKGVVASDGKKNALAAAEARRKGNLTQGQYVLGGKSTKKPLDPREAARIAAERRLLDSKYCLPCNEIIELLGYTSSEEEEDGDDEVEVVDSVDVVKMPRAKVDKTGIEKKKQCVEDMKPPANAKSENSGSTDGVIDLTDDSFDANNLPPKQQHIKSKVAVSSRIKQWECSCCTLINERSYLSCQACDTPSNTAIEAALPKSTTGDESWNCPQCTYSNPSSLNACDACRLKRPAIDTADEEDEKMKSTLKKEVEKSRETFNGFNIYGDKKSPPWACESSYPRA